MKSTFRRSLGLCMISTSVEERLDGGSFTSAHDA